MTVAAREKPSQVDLAIEALLCRWLSPRQLSEVSGRVNPNGLIRDSRAEAARRGLVWREMWVRNERGRRYKMHRVERSGELGPSGPVNTADQSGAADPADGGGASYEAGL